MNPRPLALSLSVLWTVLHMLLLLLGTYYFIVIQWIWSKSWTQSNTGMIVNFLGLILSLHSTCHRHVDHISNQISRVIGIMYRLKHIYPQSVLQMLYNALIVPHFTYCLLVCDILSFYLRRSQTSFNSKESSSNECWWKLCCV